MSDLNVVDNIPNLEISVFVHFRGSLEEAETEIDQLELKLEKV